MDISFQFDCIYDTDSLIHQNPEKDKGIKTPINLTKIEFAKN